MAVSKMLSRIQKFVTAPGFWWAHDPQLWIELFVIANLAILAVDIYIAHSVNSFQKRGEYIPLGLSLIAPPILGILTGVCWTWQVKQPWHVVGYVIGALSVLVGLGGVLYHLESRFFLDKTLKSLTYAAPFAAPLAYTGLGFLLLMNRMLAPRSAEWARWVIFMALGGFFGNFVLSLTDHAENGFFMSTEWVPVISSAFATGFLVVVLLMPITRRFLDFCVVVMIMQGLVGILGFWFHVQANLVEPGASVWDKLVNGAPPLAPLLFPNLVGLALIGIWSLIPHVPESEKSRSWLGATYDWAHPSLIRYASER
jgi:hypothetical protein